MTYIPQCDCCHKKNISLAPMLKDATWQSLAEEHEFLCDKCVFDRAAKRQVDLTFDDLLPCAFNLFHHPQSWFDLFLSAEDFDPFAHALSKDWLDALVIASLTATANQVRP
jgi:hypothetical protein